MRLITDHRRLFYWSTKTYSYKASYCRTLENAFMKLGLATDVNEVRVVEARSSED